VSAYSRWIVKFGLVFLEDVHESALLDD